MSHTVSPSAVAAHPTTVPVSNRILGPVITSIVDGRTLPSPDWIARRLERCAPLPDQSSRACATA